MEEAMSPVSVRISHERTSLVIAASGVLISGLNTCSPATTPGAAPSQTSFLGLPPIVLFLLGVTAAFLILASLRVLLAPAQGGASSAMATASSPATPAVLVILVILLVGAVVAILALSAALGGLRAVPGRPTQTSGATQDDAQDRTAPTIIVIENARRGVEIGHEDDRVVIIPRSE
jgi:hypothetical protein